MKSQLCLLSSVLLALALLIQPMQASFAAPQPSTGDLVFDFTANAALALWKSGAGTLPFPGTSGDYRGYVLKLDAPVQEDGSLGAPGLLTVPHNKYDGYIQGTYPEFTVQKGDRFQVTVGCEYGAKNCYVTYRLDYINTGGATKIFWSWKEKYEGRTYNANVDLSQLAGQKVRFVLTMLATGYASEDRPLWVAPRIVRPGNGLTPMPTLTATATPFDTPPPVLPPGCDRASFVADVTVRDGTTFAPGAAFTKTWRLKNSGSCAWTRDYALVFYSGEQMGAPTLVNLPWPVAPGAMVDVTVNAVAPVAPGQYRSDWILRNASGGLFGIGSNGDKPFWMLINVVGAPPLAETGYDFAANLCAAEWRSGAGILTCPFTDGDSRGFALPAPLRLEDGSMASSAILTRPQNKYDGYIQATFPTFTVQPGDRFQAVVGCEHNISCYVTFRLETLTTGGAPRIFWKWTEKNEGKTYRVDLDLSPLAGQSLRFVLTTLAAGPATNDRAVWAEPRIIRPGLQPLTPTPTPTPIPSPGTVVPNPLIRALYMLDSSSGWAVGDTYTLRTTNGGATWYNVLPDVVPGGAFFLNSTTGWVLTSSGALYRTTNGGAQWTQFDFPLCGENLQCTLQFLNSADGFLLSGSPIGMFKYPVSLYQTSDGGASWTLKFAHSPGEEAGGLPLGGYKYGVTFRDLQNGWINGGDYPAEAYFYLFRTSDGGLTWSQVQPALPAGYQSAFITVGAPKFFGASQAIVPVWLQTGAGRDLFLYTSTDGGNTWTPSAGFARNVDAVDIISMSSAISWGNTGNFFSTSNAGASWTPLTPNLDFGDGFRALDFVSPATGWLIQSPVNGSTPLYRTLDGGSTWAILSGSPILLPTPTPTPTETPTETPVPAFTSPYAVIGIHPEGALNLYAAPGAENPIVGSFAADTRNIERGSTFVAVGNQLWVEARIPGGVTGWVQDANLTEYISPEQFVTDSRPIQRIEQLKQAVNTSDGNLLASLVNPKRGLQISFHGTYGSMPVVFNVEQARTLFTSTEIYNWGMEGASGYYAIGTFSEIIQPKLLDVLNAPYQLHANNPSYANMFIEPWPGSYQNLNYFAVLKPPTPDIALDWRLWLAGFEYVDGAPYLMTLFHYIWEP
jgi:photosystem II stability/assembly factor-like uncharacterized protein